MLSAKQRVDLAIHLQVQSHQSEPPAWSIPSHDPVTSSLGRPVVLAVVLLARSAIRCVGTFALVRDAGPLPPNTRLPEGGQQRHTVRRHRRFGARCRPFPLGL